MSSFVLADLLEILKEVLEGIPAERRIESVKES